LVKHKESDVEKWARLKKLRLADKKSSASVKEEARYERDAVHAKKESLRTEKLQKDQATLEALHSEICERTHPLISHGSWGNIVIQLGFKYESITDSSRCANCSADIFPGELSWAMNKRIRQTNGRRSKQKFKNHYCRQCGIPQLLPEPGTSKKKESKLPNSGTPVQRKSVRQKRN